MELEQLLEALQEQGLWDQLTGAVLKQIEEAQREKNKAERVRMLREALGAEEDEDLLGAARRLVEERAESEDDGKLEAQLREELGLNDTDDIQEALRQRNERLQSLERAERQRQVQAYIEEQVKAIHYPDWLAKQFGAAIRAGEPETVEDARALIVERRKEYDGIVAELELHMRGHHHGVEVLGPVLERERGVPAFALPSFRIMEALIERQMVQERDLRTPRTINERYAAKYLEKFDKQFRHYLVQEAKLLEEAEQTSDLNLPYSVTRAIIAAAMPELVATSVFDVDTTDQADTRIYYESYAGETGAHVAVTNEAATSSEGAWISLANKHLEPGTVVVTGTGGTPTYTEGSDYVIDYANGRLWTIAAAAGGTIGNGTTLEVDYEYEAIRKGEMQPIERGKGQLSFKTLSMLADRLATQISTEAVLFARSQVGWDARARTLQMLVNEIRRYIDRGLFYQALAASLRVASNRGGTWTAASDPVADLVKYVGVSRVKVANRYYEPTAITCSLTTADLLANWDGFTQAGSRPDADLQANGYVGRVKGLPVIQSTEHSDGYLVVQNREIVMHRVYQAMQLKGPFPSYDPSTGKLIAAEQYYAEEFNGNDAPVPEKASHVVIA
jgi:hypothetical protein